MTTLLSFDNIKNFFTIILQVKIRSGYCKLLSSQRYMLFVKSMNFHVPVFQLLSDSSTLL